MCREHSKQIAIIYTLINASHNSFKRDAILLDACEIKHVSHSDVNMRASPRSGSNPLQKQG